MKIAILSPWTVKPNSVGGTERFVIDLAESFESLGNTVDVYMLSGNEYQKNNVSYKSINAFDNNREVDEYFLKKEFDNFNTKKSFENLAEKIEEKINLEDYDLIQLNSQLFLKLARNCKRIFTIHTNPFEYKLDWGEKSFSIMLEIMKEEFDTTNTHFVTPSKHYAKEYQELSKVMIDFIPHAIDVSRIKTEKEKDQIYEEMNIPKDKELILLPSRLEPIQKQPMLFMKAFERQEDRLKKNYKVICTGADKQYEQFKQEILDFCHMNQIDISITRFEEMADGYKAADIVVLPSQSESFGYSALESLSLGIVTVLNEIPTYMEIVEGADNYYSFHNSVESLEEVLRVVLEKQLPRVSQKEDWVARYSIQSFGKKYLELIKN